MSGCKKSNTVTFRASRKIAASPSSVVAGFEDVSQPRYLPTVTLELTSSGGTLVDWSQDFENPDIGRRMERISVPADQVVDRGATQTGCPSCEDGEGSGDTMGRV
jgi:hypothetical protein